jgi:hypothetical protein
MNVGGLETDPAVALWTKMGVPATFQVVADPADRNRGGDARYDPELAALNEVSEGPVRQAFDRVKNTSLFSYRIAHRRIGLKHPPQARRPRF